MRGSSTKGATVLRQGPAVRARAPLTAGSHHSLHCFDGLLRASPLMPFVATSLLGLSAITLRDYMLGTPGRASSVARLCVARRVRSGRLVSLDRRGPAMGVAGDGVYGDGPGGCAYRGARRQVCGGGSTPPA